MRSTMPEFESCFYSFFFFLLRERERENGSYKLDLAVVKLISTIFRTASPIVRVDWIFNFHPKVN